MPFFRFLLAVGVEKESNSNKEENKWRKKVTLMKKIRFHHSLLPHKFVRIPLGYKVTQSRCLFVSNIFKNLGLYDCHFFLL